MDARRPLPNSPQNFPGAERLATLPANLRRYDIAPGGCWIFRSRSSNGYATNTSVKGRKGNAYRLIWEHLNGRVPEGMELDHLCDNGRGGCVNPFHLKLCTHSENMTRSERTIPGKHARKTHCPKGHPYSGDNLQIEIRKNGQAERHCRTCKRARTLAWREKNREAVLAKQREYDRTRRDKSRKAEMDRRYRERKRAEREAS